MESVAEEEANWLAGAPLVTDQAAIRLARLGLSVADAATE